MRDRPESRRTSLVLSSLPGMAMGPQAVASEYRPRARRNDGSLVAAAATESSAAAFPRGTMPSSMPIFAAMARHVASDGVELNVEVAGTDSGPTVVLVHGLMSSIAMAWRAVIDQLAERGLRVVAFDLRGHGQSGAPHGTHHYGDVRMVDDLFEVVDAFASPDAVVVGYSMGGAITLLALERGLAVRAAVVAAAAPAVLTWSPSDEATKSSVVAVLEGSTEPDDATKGIVTFLDAVGADKAALADLIRGHQPVVEHWDRIKVPVVVLAGKDDTIAARPTDIAERIVESRTVVVPGDHYTAAHVPAFVETIVGVVDGH